MYEAFYNLKRQPFRLTPDPAFMCMTAHHREALAGLVYSVCSRPGLTVLTGEAGTGKTTLLYSLSDLLAKRRYLTALCTNPILTRQELFDFLIQAFAIPCDSTLKNRQLVALHDTLLRQTTDGRSAVFIVDEAHRLPVDLLEEIRLLSNVETANEKLLHIILAGQPELDTILHQPQFRQLKQRVSCFCKLVPLNGLEIKEYIDHRLLEAGLPGQTLFPETLIGKIHEYSGGLPRLVNSLCDAALRTAFATRSAAVTLPIIEEAAKDLELIPAAPPEPRPVEPTPLAPKRVNGHAGDAAPMREPVVPLESYASRQKSMGFFGSLMDRWK